MKTKLLFLALFCSGAFASFSQETTGHQSQTLVCGLNPIQPSALNDEPEQVLEGIVIRGCRGNSCKYYVDGCSILFCESRIEAEIAPVPLFSIRVFPNPSTDFIQLKLSEEQTISEIKIVDILGQNRFETDHFDVNYARIDVSGFKTGTYFLQVNAGGKFYTEQFIVKH